MTIRTKPTFSAMSFLATAGKGRRLDTYDKNQTVFAQGDTSNAVFYIQSGKVKIAVTSVHGKEAVSAVLGVNEFFGEGCLAEQMARTSTATALIEARIMRVEKSTFARALQAEPEMSSLFLSHMVARSLRTEADLVDQLSNSSEKRLARLLLILANYGSESPLEPIIAKISQETLAEMIGTTRSRVSFFMNKFRKLGYIDYKDRILVKPALLSAVLHDQPHIGASFVDGHPNVIGRSA